MVTSSLIIVRVRDAMLRKFGRGIEDPRDRAQRRLARYAFVLSVTLCIGLGLYLTSRDDSLSLRMKQAGLGMNLVASAIFAAIFAFLSDREHERLVSNGIERSFVEHSRLMLEQWRNLNLLYVPTDHYSSTTSFDARFNRDLMRSIEGSTTYYFRGVSAKYVAARLVAARRCPTIVKLVIPGPTADGSLRRRVADRMKNPKYSHKPADLLLHEMREELLESIVALYDSRSYGTIEIALCDETAVTRVEITDDSLFVSWYHGAESQGQAFPETLRFGLRSFQYQVARLDIMRTVELSDRVLRFGGETTDNRLTDLLSPLAGESLDMRRLSGLRAAYQARMAPFLDFLQKAR